MTYGIALRNEAGDNLVDVTGGFTYYHKSSGTCLNPWDEGQGGGSGSSAMPFAYSGYGTVWYCNLYPCDEYDTDMFSGLYPIKSFINSSFIMDYKEKLQYAASGWEQIYLYTSYQGYVLRRWKPKPVSTNPNDLIFIQVPAEGLINCMSDWMEYTSPDYYGNPVSVGLTGYAVPHISYTGPNLGYKVVSTDLPPQQDGNIGVAVYDYDGSLKFDTTRNIASFVDHIFLSASDTEDIIMNGTTRTFTLRKPVANMYMSSEGMTSFYSRFYNNEKRFHSLRIRQVASDQFEVSREVQVKYVGSNTYPTARIYSNFRDALFLIGDFA